MKPHIVVVVVELGIVAAVAVVVEHGIVVVGLVQLLVLNRQLVEPVELVLVQMGTIGRLVTEHSSADVHALEELE